MNRTGLFVVCLLLATMAISGCGQIQWADLTKITWTENQKLAAADTGFQAALTAVVMLRKQSAFTAKEGEMIEMVAVAGSQALDRWRAAIELGQKTSGYDEQVAGLTRELTAMRIAGDRTAAAKGGE